jgi:hypothetical protein
VWVLTCCALLCVAELQLTHIVDNISSLPSSYCSRVFPRPRVTGVSLPNHTHYHFHTHASSPTHAMPQAPSLSR